MITPIITVKHSCVLRVGETLHPLNPSNPNLCGLTIMSLIDNNMLCILLDNKTIDTTKVCRFYIDGIDVDSCNPAYKIGTPFGYITVKYTGPRDINPYLCAEEAMLAIRDIIYGREFTPEELGIVSSPAEDNS